MDPKRKSFSGADEFGVEVVAVAAVDGVDFRLPRGKACSVIVSGGVSRCCVPVLLLGVFEEHFIGLLLAPSRQFY